MFGRRDAAMPIYKTLKAKGPFMKLIMDQKPDVQFLLDSEAPAPAEELKEFLKKEGMEQLCN